MKKAILQFFGVAALTALMLYNVQLTESVSGADISLAALGNVAVAQNEFPWPPPPPSPVGQTSALNGCRLELGGGRFTSSVEINCYDNYVCTTCTCTPRACGQV